ncbi:MAG: hypothetical protein SFU83_14970 [Meiothermus sp.]|nr:hypothetical protein [Meiothermus sp.]
MIGWHSQLGVASSQTNGTTIAATLAAGANVGDLVVVFVLGDRASDITANSGTGGTALSVSDSAGNSWSFGSPRAEASVNSATDADFAVAVAWSVLTSAMVNGGTVTMTGPAFMFERGIMVHRFVHESTSGGVVASSIAPGGTAGAAVTSLSVGPTHTGQSKHSLVVGSLGQRNSYNRAPTLANYQRVGLRDSGTDAVYSFRLSAYAGILAPQITSRPLNPSWTGNSDAGLVYQVLQEANPPSAWWDTSGTNRAADRFTTDNGVLRFRQETESQGLSYTVPDLSLLARRLDGNGLRLDGTSGAGNYVVTPGTKPDRYRMRVKLPSSTTNANIWGLVFRQSGTTFWRAGVRFETSGPASIRLYRYSAANTIAQTISLAGGVLNLGSTYDIEVRDDGSVISVWYKLDSSSTWIQAGSNQTDSTYGTQAGAGVCYGHESGDSSAATSLTTSAGIIRWEAFTAATGPASATLTPQSSTHSQVNLSLVPGVITVGLTAQANTHAQVNLGLEPGVVTVGLSPSGNLHTPVALSPAPGAATATLTAQTLTHSLVDLIPAPATGVVNISPQTNTHTATALGLEPGLVTIGLSPQTSTHSPVALGLVPGAAPVSLEAQSSTHSTVTLDPVPQPVVLALGAQTLTHTAVDLGLEPGTITASLTAQSLSHVPVTLGPTPNAVVLALAAQSSTHTPVALGLVPGVASVTLTPATLTHSTVALAVDGSEVVSLAQITLTHTPVALGLVPGVASVSLTAQTNTHTPTALGLQPGPIAATLTAQSLTHTPVAFTFAFGAALVALTPRTVTHAPVALGLVPGPNTATLTAQSLAHAAVALSPQPQPVVLALGPQSLAHTALTLSVAPGVAAAALQAQSLSHTATALGLAPGLASVSITPLSLTHTATALGLIRKIKGKWTSSAAPVERWTTDEQASTGWTTKPKTGGWTTEGE